MVAEATLFTSAFLAATLLPFSSEAAFVVALKSDMTLSHAMLFASAGNLLAILLNYALGYFLYTKTHKKLSRSSLGSRAVALGESNGYFIFFLSWLPLIGDPLTLVSGLLRLNFLSFVLIAGSLRVGRYYLLSLMV